MEKSAAQPKAHKILVMEDNNDIRGMLRNVLKEKGYDVVSFADGALAVKWLSENSPDLALLDLRVPHQSGFQVMQAIRKKDKNSGGYVPVIVLTGVYTSRNDKVEALDLGADDFLPKPFDLYELLARVRSLLRVQELYKQSQFLATHDPLTGCYNRRYLMDMLAREAQRSKRTKEPLSFVMVDLDEFKQINDQHGHEVGDEALLFLTACFREFFRAVDCVARLGGDEFAVVLPGCGSKEAGRVADRLLKFAKSPKQQAALPKGLKGKLHFSVGLATLPDHTNDIKKLLALADEALYNAKKAGHDQYRIAA